MNTAKPAAAPAGGKATPGEAGRRPLRILLVDDMKPVLTAVALSSDATTLAFVGADGPNPTHLFIRRLDQLQATMLPSTEGASAPFFSPDGQWVAFFGGGKLKKVAVSGGAAVTLCDAPNGRGGSWADDGSIVFQPESTPGNSLMRVSAAGGTPSPLIHLADGEAMQRWPQMLPGSKAVLYTSLGTGGSVFEAGQIVVPDDSIHKHESENPGPRKIQKRAAEDTYSKRGQDWPNSGGISEQPAESAFTRLLRGAQKVASLRQVSILAVRALHGHRPSSRARVISRT
jgi:hypothetical protein